MLPGHKLPREEPSRSKAKLSCPLRSLCPGQEEEEEGDEAEQTRGTRSCRVAVGLPRESCDSLDVCLAVPRQDVGLTSNERR